MRTIRRQRDTDVQTFPPPPGDDDAPGRLSKGNIAVLVAFFLVLGVMVAGSLVKLPYAIYSPGPTVDTLGDALTNSGDTDAKAGPMIAIEGLPTYKGEGELRFTTVSVAGGPGYPVDVWDTLGAWIDPSQDVFPVEDVFDPRQTEEEVAEENAEMMDTSQEEAAAVALRAIGKEVPVYIAINDLTKPSKAKDVLRKGDRLIRVGGVDVTSSDSVLEGLQTVKPGERVTIVVNRGGKDLTVKATTIEFKGRTALGVLLQLEHDFPAKVKISAGAVGGPSAGLMFSLGIYDKLTPGSLTGNRQVAGTGTLDDHGQVGPIGGIKQKMAGARSSGSDFFLAPADNCAEVVGNIPSGLEVFRVATFDEAKTAVEAIASGRTGNLPRC